MTTVAAEYPTRIGDRRRRARGDRRAVSASRQRRTGIVSEAVVARYIHDLAEHGRRVHGAIVRPEEATR